MKTALITGANRGIGLEFCKQLKEKGYKILAACRKGNEDLSQIADVVIENCEVTCGESLMKAKEALSGETVDLLINNAGILRNETFPETNYDSIEQQFLVNSLGPIKTTEAFLPLLAKGAKVIAVTSRMASIADNTSGGYYGYRASKSALNALFASLKYDLERNGIATLLLHPGYVQTDMTGGQGMITPTESVSGMLSQIEALEVKTPLKMVSFKGETIPW